VFGHRHAGLFRDDVHATSETAPSEFRWSSDDTTVARVDQRGVVFALAVGTARIGATYRGIAASNPTVVDVRRE